MIGGGDGGIARECCKHPLVKSVTQCEIDEVKGILIWVSLSFMLVNLSLELATQSFIEFKSLFLSSQQSL